MLARIRCGNLEENNKYWLEEEKRKCILCQASEGTLKHLLQDCAAVERSDLGEETVVAGKDEEKVFNWIRNIEKKRASINCKV